MAKRIKDEDVKPEQLTDEDVKLEQPAQTDGDASPTKAVPAGFRRFVGPSSISHQQAVYVSSPAGLIDLPAGEDWYLPLVEAGILKECAI